MSGGKKNMVDFLDLEDPVIAMGIGGGKGTR